VWITFSSDTKTSTAGFWHSATATISEIVTLGQIQGRITIKTDKKFVDAIEQLKTRLGADDCISFIEFVGHGHPGAWSIKTGKDENNDKKGLFSAILTGTDLETALGNRPPEATEVNDKNAEALKWLASRICKTPDRVDLMICKQAQGEIGEAFCKRLSKVLKITVWGNTGKIAGFGTGEWKSFEP